MWADRLFDRWIKVPIALHGDFAVFKNGIVTRRKFANAFPNRAGVGDVLIRQKFVDGCRVDFAAHARDCGQTFQFAAKNQSVVFDGIVQWFLSNAITSQHQSVAVGIPNGDGEHAIELRKTIRSDIFIGVNDCLAITVGRELVTAPFQATTQCLVVIDFTIEDHAYRAVFVGHWLSSTSQIDDA